jgi:hypothetical protein
MSYAIAFKLTEAVDKLHEADSIIQKALGATDECYDLHCALEDLQEQLLDMARMAEEMQITE